MAEPDEKVAFDFDGHPLEAVAGQSVGAALLGAGVRSWRTTRRKERPRGVFCGIGICYDCLITIDGRANERACVVAVEDGMVVRSDAPIPGDGEGA